MFVITVKFVIHEKDIDKYLNIEHFGSTFLKDCNKASLGFHEISKDVNKPTNNSASLIQQIWEIIFLWLLNDPFFFYFLFLF